MSVDMQMTSARLAKAKTHVYNVCQQGSTITLIKAGTKDEMGEILTETTQPFKTHPVRFVPFNRRVSGSISWSEDVDILCYIAKKEVDDLSLTLTDLKQYLKMKYDSIEYNLRYIDHYSSFGTDFLYIIIGGKL